MIPLTYLWARGDGTEHVITLRQLRCLAAAMLYGYDAASDRLGISGSTVKKHLQTLYRHLDADNQAEAAIALGWLTLPAELLEPDAPSEPSGGRSVAGPWAGVARQLAPAHTAEKSGTVPIRGEVD